MGIIRTFALAAIAAGTLAIGTAALADDAHEPQAKPASGEKQHRHGMREMRGGCHGEAAGKHDHS